MSERATRSEAFDTAPVSQSVFTQTLPSGHRAPHAAGRDVQRPANTPHAHVIYKYEHIQSRRHAKHGVSQSQTRAHTVHAGSITHTSCPTRRPHSSGDRVDMEVERRGKRASSTRRCRIISCCRGNIQQETAITRIAQEVGERRMRVAEE